MRQRNLNRCRVVGRNLFRPSIGKRWPVKPALLGLFSATMLRRVGAVRALYDSVENPEQFRRRKAVAFDH